MRATFLALLIAFACKSSWQNEENTSFQEFGEAEDMQGGPVPGGKQQPENINLKVHEDNGGADRVPTTKPPYDCNAILIERIRDKCCKIPRLIPEAVTKDCMDRNMPNIIRRRYKKHKRGPMCLHDCSYRELKLLKSDDQEALDMLAINTKFMATASEEWKDILKEAITNCSNHMNTGVSSSVLFTSVGDSCAVAPLLFTKCIKKLLILQCPSSAKLSKEPGECNTDLARLVGCNPFFLTRQQNTSLARMRKFEGQNETLNFNNESLSSHRGQNTNEHNQEHQNNNNQGHQENRNQGQENQNHHENQNQGQENQGHQNQDQSQQGHSAVEVHGKLASSSDPMDPNFNKHKEQFRVYPNINDILRVTNKVIMLPQPNGVWDQPDSHQEPGLIPGTNQKPIFNRDPIRGSEYTRPPIYEPRSTTFDEWKEFVTPNIDREEVTPWSGVGPDPRRNRYLPKIHRGEDGSILSGR